MMAFYFSQWKQYLRNPECLAEKYLILWLFCAHSNSQQKAPPFLENEYYYSVVGTESLIIRILSIDSNISSLFRYLTNSFSSTVSTCLDAEKEAKVLERVAPSVIVKFYVIISKVSQSPLFVVSLVVVVSSVFLVSFMKKLVAS